MNRFGIITVLIGVAALSLSCQESGTESPEAPPSSQEKAPAAAPPVAEPETGEPETDVDPTVVDPDHYAVELENDRARVVRIRYGPGETSVMHHHPASVAVFLTDQDARFEFPDGTTETVTAGRGEAIFLPAGNHLPTNQGQEPFELIMVELKDEADESAAEAESGDDPTVVDPDHYTVALDNDRVRVLNISYGPGETSVMHYHPEAVAVFLTDQEVNFEFPDGSSQIVTAEAGEAIFTPAGPHLPTNRTQQPLEVRLVELK